MGFHPLIYNLILYLKCIITSAIQMQSAAVKEMNNLAD